jgi:hypothetical protein
MKNKKKLETNRALVGQPVKTNQSKPTAAPNTVPSQRSSREGYFRPTPSTQEIFRIAEPHRGEERRHYRIPNPHSIRSPNSRAARHRRPHHAARRIRRRRRFPRALRLRAPLHLLPRGRCRPRRARLPFLLRSHCRWCGLQRADQQPPPQVEGSGAAGDVVQEPLAYGPPPSAAAVARVHGLRQKWRGQRGRRRRWERGESTSGGGRVISSGVARSGRSILA